jgi:hypothetical protein
MHDQCKAVGQYIFFVRYNDLIPLPGDFFNKFCLPGRNAGDKEGKPGKQQEFVFHKRNFGLCERYMKVRQPGIKKTPFTD